MKTQFQDHSELLKILADLKPHHREDLHVCKEILDGGLEGVQVELNTPWHKPLTFIIGNTYIWSACMSDGVVWQIADLIDGRYQNHRGKYSSLRTSIQSVLDEELTP